ncbi:hypothetical protein GOBAR_DD21062 [Gossypium barbadense]|nr:hypothetical protein GOBAR_DD21062 [Gossypium barbadense]
MEEAVDNLMSKKLRKVFDTDKVYISFHDEQWGVPVYDDNKLFELLALSGMLMDYNWTEILKRKDLYRESFLGFDPEIVAKMGDKEIHEISSNKAMMLAESRIVRQYGSFSSFMWGYVNYKPTINKYKYPRNVPLRTPKAEAISKDLVKHGFRFVGPVIVYSFMQAAGLTIDHLVDCFRYSECAQWPAKSMDFPAACTGGLIPTICKIHEISTSLTKTPSNLS